MLTYARPLQQVITALERLPGIGPKSAQRLAFHLLRTGEPEVRNLAEALVAVKTEIRDCGRCFNFSDSELCSLCRDPSRESGLLCVVEEPSDLMALERSGEFRGLYHVLQGRLSPLEGIGHDELRIDELLQRVAGEGVREVILATSPTVEGDATALELGRLLSAGDGAVPRITRIALGLPVGGDLDYADGVTIARSLRGRRTLDDQ